MYFTHIPITDVAVLTYLLITALALSLMQCGLYFPISMPSRL